MQNIVYICGNFNLLPFIVIQINNSIISIMNNIIKFIYIYKIRVKSSDYECEIVIIWLRLE